MWLYRISWQWKSFYMYIKKIPTFRLEIYNKDFICILYSGIDLYNTLHRKHSTYKCKYTWLFLWWCALHITKDFSFLFAFFFFEFRDFERKSFSYYMYQTLQQSRRAVVRMSIYRSYIRTIYGLLFLGVDFQCRAHTTISI